MARAKGCDNLQSFDFTRVTVKCQTKPSSGFYLPFPIQSKRPTEEIVIPSEEPADKKSSGDEAKPSRPSVKIEVMEENLNIRLEPGDHRPEK